SVDTGNSFYVATSGGLAAQVANGNLRSVVGNNGLFGSPGQFPVSTFQNANYFRDIFFVPSPTGGVASLTLNPASVTGGDPSTGTVALTNPAPAGGAEVALLSGNGAAPVPASVTVAEGATTGTFAVNTTFVASQTSASI